jgi:hypothetical protein
VLAPMLFSGAVNIHGTKAGALCGCSTSDLQIPDMGCELRKTCRHAAICA